MHQWANVCLERKPNNVVHCPFCGIASIVTPEYSDWRCSHLWGVHQSDSTVLFEFQHSTPEQLRIELGKLNT